MKIYGYQRKVTGNDLFLFFFLYFLLILPRTACGFEILTFGDSITKGWPYVAYNQNGTMRGGYQQKLAAYLADEGYPSHVYNWGVGGESTPEGVNRISSVLGSRAAHYVLIMEGANDVLNGISASTTSENIGIMIDRSRQRHVIPIVGNITPNTMNATYDSRVRNVYNPEVEKIVAAKEVSLARQFEALRPEWETYPLHYGDHLHPNIDGYRRIATTWCNVIVEVNRPKPPVGAYMLLLLHH